MAEVTVAKLKITVEEALRTIPRYHGKFELNSVRGRKVSPADSLSPKELNAVMVKVVNRIGAVLSNTRREAVNPLIREIKNKLK